MLTPGDSIPDTFGKILSETDSSNSFTNVKRGMNNLLSFSDEKTNIESFNEINYRGMIEFLEVMAPYDPNIDLSNPENDANGNFKASSVYNGATSINDMNTKLNFQINRLNNNKMLNKQDRNKINRGVEKLADNTAEASFKLAKSLGKESPETMKEAITNHNANIKNTRNLIMVLQNLIII
jgi:hypothetical protein